MGEGGCAEGVGRAPPKIWEAIGVFSSSWGVIYIEGGRGTHPLLQERGRRPRGGEEAGGQGWEP